jgi:hypothetical protein
VITSTFSLKGFELVELKGSNVDQSLLKQNSAVTPRLTRVRREHSDAATISRPSEYAKFEMSVSHGSGEVASG